MIKILDETIKRYAETGDILAFKEIIQVMQDNDNVSQSCQFKNGFNALRNVAVHETNDFVAELSSPKNFLQRTVTIKQKSFNMLNIILCLLRMRLIKNEELYLEFARAVLQYRLGCKPTNLQSQVPLQGNSKAADFEILQTYIQAGRTYNTSDSYLIDLYEKDRRLFWVKVIPDPLPLLQIALATEDKTLFNYIVSVLEERGVP